MKFLVLLTPVSGKMEELKALIVPEVKGMWESYKAGHLREFYFASSPTVVTFIYEVADVAALHAQVNQLPMVQAGLLDKQVIELGPFPQFELLFKTE